METKITIICVIPFAFHTLVLNIILGQSLCMGCDGSNSSRSIMRPNVSHQYSVESSNRLPSVIKKIFPIVIAFDFNDIFLLTDIVL